MNKRILVSVLAALLALASGCTTTGSSGGDPAARRAVINTGVDNALSQLFQQVPGSRELVGQAKGVLVFPNVIQAGFVVAAARGDGALRIGGKTTTYHAMTSGSFGFQAGAKSTAVFLLFMTNDALKGFQNSNGWTVDADASVTVISVGASAQVTSATAQRPVIGYVLSNGGLMGGVSLGGTRVTQLNL
jgi:lipid-binding SYLF domain-containing protein